MPDSLFRRLSICDTITRPLGILFRNFGLFVSLGAVFVLPMVFVLCFKMHQVVKMIEDIKIDENFDMEAWMMENMEAFVSLWVMMILVTIIFGISTDAAVTRATAMIYADVRPSWIECVTEGFRKLCSIFCFRASLQVLLLVIALVIGIFTGILSVVLVLIFGNGASVAMTLLGQIVNFVVMYVIMVAMLAAVPAIVVEQKTWCKDAMERSWELTTNKRCFLFCALVLYFFAVALPISLVYGGITYAVLGSHGIATAKGAIAYGFLLLLFVPLRSIFVTVLYVDLRVEKEACNQQVLANNLRAATYDAVLLDSNEQKLNKGVAYKDAVNDDKMGASPVKGENIV